MILRSLVAIAALSFSLPAAAIDCEALQRQATPVEGLNLLPSAEQPNSAYINLDAPAGQAFELHVIGSYEGSGTVRIGPTEKPVVLFLSAYEAGLWTIVEEPGARLVRVITAGIHPQRVTGVHDNTPIEVAECIRGHAYQWQSQAGGIDYMTDEFRSFLARARSGTGLVEASFQGNYDFAIDFSVPPRPQDFATVVIPRADKPRDTINLDPLAVLAEYRSRLDTVAPELRPTLEILVTLMEEGRYPILRPSNGPGGDRTAPAYLQPYFSAQALRRRPAENAHGGGTFIGTAGTDRYDSPRGDDIFVTGAGMDVIQDSWGNDLANGGPDNDIIDLGWGTDTVVVEAGWGDDVVGKTCHFFRLRDADIERLNWRHPYVNFVVFGPGIAPADMTWESEEVLLHRPSGSRLTLQDDCFSLVFTESGALVPFEEVASRDQPPVLELSDQTADRSQPSPTPLNETAVCEQQIERVMQAIREAREAERQHRIQLEAERSHTPIGLLFRSLSILAVLY